MHPNELDPIHPVTLCSLNIGYGFSPFLISFFPTRGKEEAFESVESFDNLIWGEM